MGQNNMQIENDIKKLSKKFVFIHQVLPNALLASFIQTHPSTHARTHTHTQVLSVTAYFCHACQPFRGWGWMHSWGATGYQREQLRGVCMLIVTLMPWCCDVCRAGQGIFLSNCCSDRSCVLCTPPCCWGLSQGPQH